MSQASHWLAVAVLLVAIGLGVAGQLLIKLGLNRLGQSPSPAKVLASILTPLVFGGFACYGISSLLYLQALSRLPLSYAYPMIAISYVAVVLASWKFLGEDINALRIGGLAVIIIGVILVALSYGPAHATAVRAAAPKR
ncbi:MAG: EamA family transporter [Armatimonadetes bacterium]|nr:EamA family transporter [Armatimonadota bacterium]